MAVAPLPPESPSPKSVKSGCATLQPTLSSPKAPKDDNRVKLLSVGFNQDFGCFACATSNGFRIYNSEPFMETFRRDFKNGGIGLVEMLFRCNILALVGGGTNPRYMPNKVMIWDDHQSRCIGELSFRSEVRGVRLRRDRIIVILEHKIYVYNFSDLKLLQHIDTISNPKGLCVLSTLSDSSVVACPGLHRGQVRVEHYTLKKTKFIVAHDASLACLALTPDGRILATASTKGTLIRIFNTLDGTKLQELRRGTDKAEIYSISFASTAQWLAVSSDRGTVHIFSLNVHAAGEDIKSSDSLQSLMSQTYTNGNGTAVGSPTANSNPISFISGNPSSSLHFMKGVLPRYFSSEWSFAQFRLPDETRSIVAFGSQKNTVIIISLDGSFYTCSFDPIEGGEMVQCDYKKFVS